MGHAAEWLRESQPQGFILCLKPKLKVQQEEPPPWLVVCSPLISKVVQIIGLRKDLYWKYWVDSSSELLSLVRKLLLCPHLPGFLLGFWCSFWSGLAEVAVHGAKCLSLSLGNKPQDSQSGVTPTTPPSFEVMKAEIGSLWKRHLNGIGALTEVAW